jgi:hypothetical protein
MLGWLVIVAAIALGWYKINLWWIVLLVFAAFALSYLSGSAARGRDLLSKSSIQGFLLQVLFALVLYAVGYYARGFF